MTVKLSPQKISRMLAYFFAGMPQTEIARKVGVDQSTVSLCVSRFKNRVEEIGLLASGKEHNVLGEVDTLRSLSVELTRNRLTMEEAKQGARIFSALCNTLAAPLGFSHHTFAQLHYYRSSGTSSNRPSGRRSGGLPAPKKNRSSASRTAAFSLPWPLDNISAKW